MEIMSHVDHRAFFLVGPGPALDAIKEYVEGHRAFRRHVLACGEKYGFEQATTCMSAVIFDEPPRVGEGWRRAKKRFLKLSPNAYSPNLQSKKGKAISAELKSVTEPRYLKIGDMEITDIPGPRYGNVVLYPTYAVFADGRIVLALPKAQAKDEVPTPKGCTPLKLSEYISMVEREPAEDPKA